MENNISKELIVIANVDDFILDWQFNNVPSERNQILIQEELYEISVTDKFKALFELGFVDTAIQLSVSLNYFRSIAHLFIQLLSKREGNELKSEKVDIVFDDETLYGFIESKPFFPGWEFIDFQRLQNININLNKVLDSELEKFNGSVADYLISKSPDIKLIGRIFFHLVENKGADEPFAFIATYTSGINQQGKSKHLPLKSALSEYKNDEGKLLNLLTTVNKAANKSKFIQELIDTGEIFHPLGLSSKDAYTFLREIPLYEESGILCRIPKWWSRKRYKANVEIQLGKKNPVFVGKNALMDFNIDIVLGGERLTKEDIKKLLNETEGLALLKGKWVEVNHQTLKEVLKVYQLAEKVTENDTINIIDALRLQMNATKFLKLSNDSIDVEVSNGEWLSSVIGKLVNPEKIDDIKLKKDFQAKLRPYQVKGLNWLDYMKNLGLGACLADDMGLGKTLQIMALLNNSKLKKIEKTLLIIPASLISNWSNELAKFTPNFKFVVVHSSEAKKQNSNKDEIEEALFNADYSLYITTYGMVLRYDWLKKVEWDNIIIDEAQAIKNPETKQSKEVKKLKGKFKVALTGTPIENKLFDLWSIFDFLNKGLLGSMSEFKEFNKQLEVRTEGYVKLRRVISPFLLRRLKTDKAIINDLPDKIEMKTYVNLSKTQAVLYSKMIGDMLEKLDDLSNFERKGVILSVLMKSKQLCNHPDQYLGQSSFTENESGKFLVLRELCETIYEKREKVIIFTQFKEITEPLREYLETVFEHKGLVLHGQTPIKKRKEIIESFQSDEYIPFLILSLKAGGVGLNLTSANHVIHFDRWWNPAVENQATDRAFRIGQKKNVIVHKFISKGTIEEKIDLMIENKTGLSLKIIPTKQENWITEFDNKQLYDLFKLEV